MSAALVAEGAAVKARTRLGEADVVRLLTFASVIAVHSIAATTSSTDRGAGAALMLLHFTRETFFMLSAFVLFHVYGGGELRVLRFWRRRFPVIAAPYLLWSLVYWLTTDRDLAVLGRDLISGDASYHLYFLLVSMQLYLVFPLLRSLVRRTHGHHGVLFSVSLLLEVVILWWCHWGSPATGFWSGVHARAFTLLPTYEFYVVVGSLAAVHLTRLRRWVDDHGATVLVGVIGGALLQELVYAVHLRDGDIAGWAVDPLQPTMIVWSVAASVGLYALGRAVERRGRPGIWRRVLTEGSLISLGVYLVHPLVITALVAAGLSRLPSPGSTLVVWFGACVLSTAAIVLVARTPLSWWLTGRPQRRRGGAR